MKKGVDLDPGTATEVSNVADKYTDLTGGQLFNVSDASRTAEQQAAAMYDNYANDRAPSYRDTALEQKIHDAYDAGVDAGESKDDTVERMREVIQNAADGGEFISDHMAGGEAFDVSKTDSNGRSIDFDKLKAAADANGYDVQVEQNHYHLQKRR